MSNVTEIFGSEVFNDTVMRAKLPEDTYEALIETITEGKPLSLETANVVATAMKDWALEKGATHYTHWFQPMTGITAEKHDSFISPADGGKAIMEFSGKELIKVRPMLLRSPRAVSAKLAKPEVIQRGIPVHMLL